MAHKNKRKSRRKKHLQQKSLAFTGLAFSLICLASLGVYHLVVAASLESNPIIVQVDPNVGIETRVKEFFEANDAAEMIPIIKCESRFRHYNQNGSILKNKAGSSAIGVAQIMSSVHPDPKVLKQYNRKFNTNLQVEDFDITTLEGNLGYALMLYELRGTRDWECSKKFRFNH